MIGRGMWRRFVLRLHSNATHEAVSTPTLWRGIRQRMLHEDKHREHAMTIEEEPPYVGVVDWSRRCACGCLMRSTSPERKCCKCLEADHARAEREAAVTAAHERRILYMKEGA